MFNVLAVIKTYLLVLLSFQSLEALWFNALAGSRHPSWLVVGLYAITGDSGPQPIAGYHCGTTPQAINEEFWYSEDVIGIINGELCNAGLHVSLCTERGWLRMG